MSILTGALAFFFVFGLLQMILASRLADLIGGAKRNPRLRGLDVLILRAAGGFIVVLAAIALVVVALTGVG